MNVVNAGDDLPDRGRPARRLLRQQPGRPVRRHGRTARPLAAASASPLASSGHPAMARGRQDKRLVLLPSHRWHFSFLNCQHCFDSNFTCGKMIFTIRVRIER